MLKNLKEDKNAKTPSFFFKEKMKKFNAKYVKFLENFYKKNYTDVRVCMHSKKNSKHHDMIILQQKKNFYSPHKHLKKKAKHIIL